MSVDRLVPVPFAADPDNPAANATRGPMTWGQAAIWKWLPGFGEDAASFNMTRVVRPPSEVDLPAALTAVGALVAAHQVLRSRYGDGPDGPYQEVHAGGVVEVLVVEVTPDDEDATSAALAAELSGKAFRHADEWPVRVAVGTSAGACRFVVLALSHLAVDWSGLELLTADFRARLGGPVPAPAWRPLDQAHYEHSPAGRRRGATALAHWRTALSTLPPSMFDHPPTAPARPRFQRLYLSSRALALAADRLATANRVSVSSVLLAAVALCLSAFSGREECVLRLIVSNRHDERRGNLVAATAQNGLFALDPVPADLTEAIRRAYRSGLVAYASGHYDPAALDALIAEVGRDRGVHFDHIAYFNDARGQDRWRDVDATDLTPARLAGLRAETVVGHDTAYDSYDVKFFLAVEPAPDRALLYLLADTAYVPPHVVEAMLRGVETVLVEAAFRPVAVTEVAALTGLRPPARPGWWRTGAGWVRPEAVAEVVTAAAGGARTAVFRAPECDTGLVAYVVAPELAGTLPALHAHVVELLDGRSDAVAPARYVLCAAPPADYERMAAAWRAVTPVDAGSGRAPG
jgi:hypothetical protein